MRLGPVADPSADPVGSPNRPVKVDFGPWSPDDLPSSQPGQERDLQGATHNARPGTDRTRKSGT